MTFILPNAAGSLESSPSLERRPITLAVTGRDVYLAGRFDNWIPVALDASNEDEGGAQILVDLTAFAPPRAAGAPPDLLSFTADRVKAISRGSFRAEGTLGAGETEGKATAIFQSPATHTPFIAVTLPIDRHAFPELWAELVDMASRTTGRETHLYPRGWVRTPELATA